MSETSPTMDATEPRPAGTVTQALGLMFMGLSLVALLLVGLVGGALDEPLFLGGVALVLLVSSYLVVRYGFWSTVVGLVATVAGLSTFWMFFGLFAPQAPTEFTAGAMWVFGFFMALIGGIRAIVKRRSGVASPTSGETRTRTIAVTVVILAAVVSTVLSIANRERATADEAEGATRLEADGFEFLPGTLTIEHGGSVLIHNADPFLHTFTIDTEDGTARIIDAVVNPGNDVIVVVDEPPGEYEFYCMPHSDMRGTLIIE